MSWRVIFNFFLGLALVAVFIVFNYPALSHLLRKPCATPITYNVGTFDNRFGISKQYFLSVIAEAETIWEKPLGKELFTYAPEDSELPINLIYDYRQETTKTLTGLEGVVKQDEATYNSLEAKYLNLKAEYTSAKSAYEAHVRAFEETNSAYQKQVEAWNRGKRNSKEQFDQLESARKDLEAAAAELKTEETRLNDIVREINSLVNTLNGLAKSLNLNAETYNTIGATRGESFTGGIYYNTSSEQGIDIYEFSSRDKLVRIMAHELGHALGLEHVSDPQAIMYYLNEGDREVLTNADLSALKSLCGVE